MVGRSAQGRLSPRDGSGRERHLAESYVALSIPCKRDAGLCLALYGARERRLGSAPCVRPVRTAALGAADEALGRCAPSGPSELYGSSVRVLRTAHPACRRPSSAGSSRLALLSHMQLRWIFNPFTGS
jgi:hypothetical protein